ncbi:MAG: hypothetical protein A3H70_04610 [Candidatus Komeilibacteria bacterium RIFCSPLOWO2_02_FULL_48_11]|uniref:HIT domain-containing protein n=1 Tax=Candidatus Komeilibacteria bacterium RIFCSPLOWO2_02_FULL_48_11 TaxID=1798553 RepID=A0A1G2BWE2_9BACT|nr:MAG: hypothetical protein A3H70_04610 [Candidatus Komeilibacteria bacterium RIFCSPLOWO2_02_FULL_48_11]
MSDCIFCKIVSGEIPSHKVYEDEAVLAFLDIHPINPGHTLVIPKEHHNDLLDTPPELQAKLIQVIGKIAPAVLKAVGALAFNLGVNNGREAGQIIFHTHFHIMPRFSNDGHKLWHGKSLGQEELSKISQTIQKHL